MLKIVNVRKKIDIQPKSNELLKLMIRAFW